MADRLEIAALASEWLGYGYPSAGEQQEAPRPVAGWPSSMVGNGSHRIDCSSFAAWMIFALYPGEYTRDDYADMQIYDAARPYSNVEWLISQGLGVERTPRPMEWSYCQTWQGTPGQSRGHARLVMTQYEGAVLCLESTISDLSRGPQWRATSWDDLNGRAGCRAVVLR